MDTTRNGSAAAVPPRPPPKPKPKPPRVLRWVLKPTPETPYGLLKITEGKDTAHYFLQALPSEIGGRAFLWTKIQRPGEEPGVYHVRIDPDPKRSTCECKGFLRWGKCRHIEASTSQLDQMPAAPATSTTSTTK